MTILDRANYQSTSQPYLDFERQCLRSLKAQPEILQQGVFFEDVSCQIHETLEGLRQNLSHVPLLSVVLVWAKRIANNNPLGVRYLEIMRELIDNHLFPGTPEDNLYSLEEYSQVCHNAIISQIKTHSSWFLQKREDAISVYISFANWLSEATLGYVKQAFDPDRVITNKRCLPYQKYVELLTLLPVREQMVAKLFYLGGARSLNDILSLDIKSVNFKDSFIDFSHGPIKYPQHVFDDLKFFIKGRKKGYVFANKQVNERINHTVPYRSLKKAAQKIGLPESFSYKDLVKDV